MSISDVDLLAPLDRESGVHRATANFEPSLDEGRGPAADTDAEADADADADEALGNFVASVQHLPLFTGMAAQLIRSIDQEDVTPAELTRLISTDAALVAHLLRIVNSSYYGLARRVGTVTEACAVLGLDLVRRTVTIAVLQRPFFAYLHDTTTARLFWKHELLCAALARHLARRAGIEVEQTSLAGLLHDVGRLVMLMRFPQHADTLLRPRTEGQEREVDDEITTFGFTHAQVGAALLECWGLPEGIVRSAHQHADETEPEDAMAAIVWRANLIAHEFGDDDDVEQPWMAAIGLDVTERRAMLDEIALLGSDPH